MTSESSSVAISCLIWSPDALLEPGRDLERRGRGRQIRYPALVTAVRENRREGEMKMELR